MASFSFPQRSHLTASAQLNALCPEPLYLQMLRTTAILNTYSNKTLNLLLSYVLYCAYCDGYRVFDLVRGLERR